MGRRNAALGPAQKEMRSASGAALLVLNHGRLVECSEPEPLSVPPYGSATMRPQLPGNRQDQRLCQSPTSYAFPAALRRLPVIR